jgi:hypothetical protein
MQVYFGYDYREECCEKMGVALIEGKIEFDENLGEFYYCSSPDRILKKCPYCKQEIERHDFDF